MDNKELLNAIAMLEKEKGIEREYMFQAIEAHLQLRTKEASEELKVQIWL